MCESFETFWQAYPLKVGKKPAREVYERIMKKTPPAKRQELEDNILQGSNRYIKNKPEWQDWLHAKTFLRQARWEDEYETVDTRIDDEINQRLGV